LESENSNLNEELDAISLLSGSKENPILDMIPKRVTQEFSEDMEGLY